MKYTAFARSWFLNPKQPGLGHYPTELDDSAGVPSLEASLEDIGEYQRRLWANRKQALLLVVHGPDTSGKDSLIRTLATYADPAGFHAWSFSRPTGTEAAHDFLDRKSTRLNSRHVRISYAEFCLKKKILIYHDFP